jgi:hypothetical protein
LLFIKTIEKRKERTLNEKDTVEPEKKRRKESEKEEKEEKVEEKYGRPDEDSDDFCIHCEDFQPDNLCVLDDGLREILEEFESLKCIRKGGCKSKCANSCKRHHCYRAAANFLRLYKREKLPLCVMATIQEFYGTSKIGFKE